MYFTIISLLVTSQGVFAQEEVSESYSFVKNEISLTYDRPITTYMPEDVMLYKKYIYKIQHNREVVYNALNLSDEQIRARENLTLESSKMYDEKFHTMLKESLKLKTLKTANASNKEIHAQEKIVKHIKKDIDKTLKFEDKSFKKILTHDQKSKYSMIRKLERRDYKASKNPKDYYKSNPKMPRFGNPQK